MSNRIPNKHGGRAKTNKNGLLFEQTTSLDSALKNMGFEVRNFKVSYKHSFIGYSVPQVKIYKEFLEKKGIDYSNYNSKKWRPDECFINERNKTAYIIEKKFQNTSGSVDEKLPSCGFKLWEYEKLFSPIGYNVKYIYVFNRWFEQSQYDDTKEYIINVGCEYYFEEIPIDKLGLEEFL